MQPATVKGADLMVRALENEGVECIFGVPGEENLHFLEALRTSRYRARRDAARAGRRVRRHLRPSHRPARRMFQHARAGRHQPGHPRVKLVAVRWGDDRKRTIQRIRR
jgi:hypothetical protein